MSSADTPEPPSLLPCPEPLPETIYLLYGDHPSGARSYGFSTTKGYADNALSRGTKVQEYVLSRPASQGTTRPEGPWIDMAGEMQLAIQRHPKWRSLVSAGIASYNGLIGVHRLIDDPQQEQRVIGVLLGFVDWLYDQGFVIVASLPGAERAEPDAYQVLDGSGRPVRAFNPDEKPDAFATASTLNAGYKQRALRGDEPFTVRPLFAALPGAAGGTDT